MNMSMSLHLFAQSAPFIEGLLSDAFSSDFYDGNWRKQQVGLRSFACILKAFLSLFLPNPMSLSWMLDCRWSVHSVS
jgi:hypothetical protein